MAVNKMERMKFGKDRRRMHHRWRVTVYYQDGGKFVGVYIGLEKAWRCAAAEEAACRQENAIREKDSRDDHYFILIPR